MSDGMSVLSPDSETYKRKQETELTVGVVQSISWNGHDVTPDVRSIDHLWHNLLEIPCPNQPHVHRELVVKDVQRVVNTFVSIRRESVEERSANAHWFTPISPIPTGNVEDHTPAVAPRAMALITSVALLTPPSTNTWNFSFGKFNPRLAFNSLVTSTRTSIPDRAKSSWRPP